MKALPKNPKSNYKDLTIEDIKALDDFKDISDDLAQQIADTIRTYTEIIYTCYIENRFDEQKAKVIELKSGQATKAA
jgi:hypothetical protein